VTPDPELLARHAAPEERRDWWLARLRRCYGLVARDSAG
jgi:O-succinylbenzoate synthase